ncbi:hypothetical protein ABN028_08390 [Actinopolymorpha sp. B17G11]|uniref:hypothetical protein n=1 Tax=Actinopolymorpha sp. B17G11 TaxID=3160861 RepID=UPI0032E3AB9F
MAIDDADRYAASSVREDGTARYVWQSVKTEDLPSYTGIIARSIAERNQWRAEYEQAKQRAGPDPGPNSASRRVA